MTTIERLKQLAQQHCNGVASVDFDPLFVPPMPEPMFFIHVYTPNPSGALPTRKTMSLTVEQAESPDVGEKIAAAARKAGLLK